MASPHPLQLLFYFESSFKDSVMEVDSVNCECCGLREECTEEYISQVKANFEGKWLCGLCSEAVRDEIKNGWKKEYNGTEAALKAHMSFCSKYKTNPAILVADGMRLMLRRRSRDLSASTAASVSSSLSEKK